MDFLTLKPDTFGLDISDLSLKIAKLQKKKNFFELVSFSECPITEGIIKNGEIKDEQKLAQIIKKSLAEVKGKKIKTKYVIASLPEEKAFLQVIQLPKMSERDLRSAVVFEAENYIPLPIEDVYLDFQIIPSDSEKADHFDVLLAALPKNIVDGYLSCLESIGLKVLALEIESMSIARALIKEEFSDRPLLLIDFGATKTSFIVFAGSSLRFTSSIPVSSRHFTQLIAKTFQVSEKKAEDMKIEYGLGQAAKLKLEESNADKGKTEGKIFEALIPALVDLIQQIKKHLDYYQAHSAHQHLAPDKDGSPAGEAGVSKIIFCGGGARLKGLLELLSLELELPVQIGNPLINIKEKKDEFSNLPPDEFLKYATAIGLALRGGKIN